MNTNNLAPKTSWIFFGILCTLVLCAFAYLFKSYLLTMVIGILLAIATANIQNFFLKITKGKKVLASTLNTLLLCVLFFAPLAYAISEILPFILQIDMIKIQKTLSGIKNFNMPDALKFINPYIKEFIAQIDLKALSANVISYAQTGISKSTSFIIDMVLVIIFYFFTHLYGTELASYLKKVSPLEKDELQGMFLELSNTVSVVFYSTIANACIQGTLFAIIAQAYGLNGLFLGLTFAFSSLIPVIGGILIYLPTSLYIFHLQGLVPALVVFLYSIIVISTIADNFIKPFIIKVINEKLLKSPTNINEFLIFFAMIAGIGTFGFWGLILGPSIVTLLVAVLRIYEILKEKSNS